MIMFKILLVSLGFCLLFQESLSGPVFSFVKAPKLDGPDKIEPLFRYLSEWKALELGPAYKSIANWLEPRLGTFTNVDNMTEYAKLLMLSIDHGNENMIGFQTPNRYHHYKDTTRMAAFQLTIMKKIDHPDGCLSAIRRVFVLYRSIFNVKEFGFGIKTETEYPKLKAHIDSALKHRITTCLDAFDNSLNSFKRNMAKFFPPMESKLDQLMSKTNEFRLMENDEIRKKLYKTAKLQTNLIELVKVPEEIDIISKECQDLINSSSASLGVAVMAQSYAPRKSDISKISKNLTLLKLLEYNRLCDIYFYSKHQYRV